MINAMIRELYLNAIPINEHTYKVNDIINVLIDIKTEIKKDRNVTANFIIIDLKVAHELIKEINKLGLTTNISIFNLNTNNVKFVGNIFDLDIFVDPYLSTTGLCIGYNKNLNPLEHIDFTGSIAFKLKLK